MPPENPHSPLSRDSTWHFKMSMAYKNLYDMIFMDFKSIFLWSSLVLFMRSQRLYVTAAVAGGFNRETEREGVNVNPLLAPLLLCNYVIRCRVTKILMLLPSLPLLFLFRRWPLGGTFLSKLWHRFGIDRSMPYATAKSKSKTQSISGQLTTCCAPFSMCAAAAAAFLI